MLFIFTYCNKQIYKLFIPILKEFFAVPAKILGKVSFILLCAPLTGMRHRSKRYLCWRRRRFPQSAAANLFRLLLAASISSLI
jgi:hypothetical protein